MMIIDVSSLSGPDGVTAGQRVDVPDAGQPRYGLGVAASPTGPGVRIVAPVDGTWPETGITFVGDGCGGAAAYPRVCDPPGAAPKPIPLYTTVDASMFAVDTVVECSVFAFAPTVSFEDAARRVLRASMWGTIGEQIWSGTSLQPGDAFLSDGTAIDVTTGNPESAGGQSPSAIVPALSALEAWSGACSPGGERVLHVPTSAMSYLAAAGLLVDDRSAPGRSRTPAGMLVVHDPGYSGDGYNGHVPNVVSFYVTSQVFVALSEPVVTGIETPSINRQTGTAELAAAFAWMCCHLTATVNLCL